MKQTIVISSFGTVTNGDRGRVETIQTTALFSTAKILRKVLEIEEIYYHLNSSETSSAKTNWKISQGVNN